jgi:hypothetical protein
MQEGQPVRKCEVCGRALLLRDRAPAQALISPEYVCANLDCCEFGIYKRERLFAAT